MTFSGWKKVLLPFDGFTRSAEQPGGAPNDGLTLTEVWGYGMQMPDGTSGSFHLDWVYLEPTLHNLTVTLAGNGEGMVSSDPAGINCSTSGGSDCSIVLTDGSVITLTATADTSSTFSGWSGACTGMDECAITIAENTSVTATFTEIEHKIHLPLVNR